MACFGKPAAATAAAATPPAAGDARRRRWRWRPHVAGVVALVGAAVAALTTGAAAAAVAAAAAPATASHLATDAVRDASLLPAASAAVAVKAAAASSPTAGAVATTVAAVLRPSAGVPPRLPSAATARVACHTDDRCMPLAEFKQSVVSWRAQAKKQPLMTSNEVDAFRDHAWALSSARTCGPRARPYRCFRENANKVLTKAWSNVVLRPRLIMAGAKPPSRGYKRSGRTYRCAQCAVHFFQWGSSCCYDGCRSVDILGGSAMFMYEYCCSTLGPQCQQWTLVHTHFPTTTWHGF
ncbi:hypothetical protein I4F81_002323 [Pyropia yezoensis]|uniref:Uncharacterized protein n=1 Tax=Pyropia yezoensis TaxID=2788 RepID=A0ACC3BP06_PYRYE|nr:hypothetical protein I4F81_002323 [Neopyropia yezoensis]